MVAALLVVSTRAAHGASTGLLVSARARREWEGHSSKLLALALGSGEDMRTLAWALFFKTPPGIACSLEQAEQKAGGSILGSTGAAKIQFHIYFLLLQSME